MNRLTETDNIIDGRVKKVITECRLALQKLYPDAEIILYGSYARGEAAAESDLDLLVLLNVEVTSLITRTIRDTLYDIGLTNDIVISAIIRSVDEWNAPISQASGLYQAIQKEGIEIS